MRRRQLLGAVGVGVFGGIAGCAGSATRPQGALAVSSSALDRETLPVRFTCDGAGVSPPVRIERVPDPTAALAVTAEYDRGVIADPVFWSLWNVPAETAQIPADLPRTGEIASLDGAKQGRRAGGEVGYEPACPPAGQPYRHRFQVYALADQLDIDGGTDHDTATEAIGNAVLASRRFTVEYGRTPGQ